MGTLHGLGIAGAAALCATYVNCASSPPQAQVVVAPPICYELRRAAATHDSTDWLGFESGILSLDPAVIVPMHGRDIPADARAARWLAWKQTREAEEAMITAVRRLDEIEGRDTVIAPRDSLLRRAEARRQEQRREHSAHYWHPLGQDSLVIVEQMGASHTVVRLHLSGHGGVAGIARFRYEPGLPHPSAVLSSELDLVGRGVICPR